MGQAICSNSLISMPSKLSSFIRKSLQQTQEKQSAKENPPNLADQVSLFDGDDQLFQRKI
jgi:hypothetical protein